MRSRRQRSSRSRLVASAAFGLLPAALTAQNWQQATPPQSPPARAAAAMATDTSLGQVVLFGGAVGSAYVGDTWTFDGTTWAQVIGVGPAARGRHALAYDSLRAAMVLFGGINGIGQNNWFGDTWEFSNGAWSQRASTNHPAVRFGHAMAFDATRGRVVMFGGRTRSGTIFLGDTWEWTGVDWTPFLPAHSPTPRMGHAMAFDPQLGQVLLFGGLQLGGPYQGDTWTWNGIDWTRLAPLHAPTPRGDAAMATDLGRNRVVLFGGYDGADHTDTFDWNGSDWLNIATTIAPPALVLPTLATGPARRHVVLFGGDDAAGTPQAATWRFGDLAAVRSFGTGCGAPPLALQPQAGSRPILGASFTSTMSPVVSGGVPFLTLGYSAANFGGLPLPLDLGAMGMPNCWLYHDLAELFLGCTLVGDTATNTSPVPSLPALVGIEVYVQGYVFAPGQNAFGVVTSNALGLRLGFS